MTLSPAVRRSIGRRVAEILQAHAPVAPPVPVERIAKALGTTVRFAPLDENLSGMSFVKDGKRVIAVNALHHPNRQRFTLAHELGHHVLHADALGSGIHVDKVILRRDALSSRGTDDLEIQANTFAAQLLMPTAMLTAIVDHSFDLNDENRLLAIARRFKVSVSALQFRLASLD